MFIVRSQARKHSTLEKQRRNKLFQERRKPQIRSLEAASTPLIWTEPFVMGAAKELPTPKTKRGSGSPEMTQNSSKVANQHLLDEFPVSLESTASPSPSVSMQNSPQTTHSSPRRRKTKKKPIQAENRVERRPSSRYTARLAKYIESHSEPRISPQTCLGASLDPFQVYPIEAKHWMHNLIDNCTHPALSCQLVCFENFLTNLANVLQT